MVGRDAARDHESKMLGSGGGGALEMVVVMFSCFLFFLNETIVTVELIIQLAETKDTWNPRHNYKIYRLIF